MDDTRARIRSVMTRPPHWLRESLALVLATLCGFVVLVVLDVILKGGLWGEWLFALTICTVGIWFLARLAEQRLPERAGFVAPPLWQAPFWAAVPLIGAPFAALTWWWG